MESPIWSKALPGNKANVVTQVPWMELAQHQQPHVSFQKPGEIDWNSGDGKYGKVIFFVDQCLILCIIISAVKLRDNQRSCPNNSCRHSAGARIDTLQTLLDFTQVPAHRFKRANHILAPRSGTLEYLGYVGYLPKLCSKSSCWLATLS